MLSGPATDRYCAIVTFLPELVTEWMRRECHPCWRSPEDQFMTQTHITHAIKAARAAS